jgi:hypothetical protein
MLNWCSKKEILPNLLLDFHGANSLQEQSERQGRVLLARKNRDKSVLNNGFWKRNARFTLPCFEDWMKQK